MLRIVLIRKIERKQNFISHRFFGAQITEFSNLAIGDLVTKGGYSSFHYRNYTIPNYKFPRLLP
jgi:hypothetical protein